jgi:hypothetical protein
LKTDDYRRLLKTDDRRGAAPKTLEVVEGPLLLAEEMDNNVAVVNEDPTRIGGAFGAARARTSAVQLEVLVESLEKAVELAHTGAGSNDKEVSQTGDLCNLQQDDIVCLPLGE